MAKPEQDGAFGWGSVEVKNLTLTTWVCLAGLALVLGGAVFGEELIERWIEGGEMKNEADKGPGFDFTRLPLPPAPERDLVSQHCQACHHLSRIEKAGGSVEGWTSRIERMIKNGSTLPAEDVPVVATYLAKALPERPRQVSQTGR